MKRGLERYREHWGKYENHGISHIFLQVQGPYVVCVVRHNFLSNREWQCLFALYRLQKCMPKFVFNEKLKF